MDDISDQRPRSAGLRRAGVTAAVGVGLTVGAAGIAAAATSPSPAPKSGAAVAPMPGHPHRHLRGPGRRGAGMGRLEGALHGTLVVPKGNGTQTVDVQRGVVTSADASSLTVKSTDGFTKRYVLDAKTVVDAGRDTIKTLAAQDEVAVVSTTSGTATHVRDLTKLKAERKARGPHDGARRLKGSPPAPGATPGDYLPGSEPSGGQPA